MLTLPAIGAILASCLGFGTLETLVGTPIGWVCLVLGALLSLAGWLWARGLLKRASPTDVAPGVELEILAMGVASGASVDRVLGVMRGFMHEPKHPNEVVDRIVELSAMTGAPMSELLRSEAERARAAARSDAREIAAKLSVRMLVPLGVCILPAFILLAVVPLFVSILGSTIGSRG